MKRTLILTPIVLGLLCTMAIAVQTAKATVMYDLNNDRIVNMADIGLVVAAFGSHPVDARWNSAADLDVNCLVNIVDVGLIATQFGWMLPTFVVPEYPIGPILGLVGFFAAFGIFSLTRQSKHNWHFLKR